jgi:branched-chain amino acid transport system permease protein
MITLVLAQMLYFAATGLARYGGDDGTGLAQRSEIAPAIDLYDPATFYWTVLVLLIVVVGLLRRLSQARFGMVLRGVKANERRLSALGVPTFRYKLTAFTLSGAICGLAGALLANQAEFVSPAYMQWTRSGELIVMVVLGGMGTMIGPILGAAVLLGLEEVLAELTQHWMLVLGPLLVAMVLYTKRGLWGLVTTDPADCELDREDTP